MEPWSEAGIEELLPGVPHMQNEGATEEQVAQPETGGHSTQVEQVPAQQTHRQGKCSQVTMWPASGNTHSVMSGNKVMH